MNIDEIKQRLRQLAERMEDRSIGWTIRKQEETPVSEIRVRNPYLQCELLVEGLIKEMEREC